MTRPPLDWLVLTAASRAQARGFAAELRARRADGRLDGVGRTLIVPDPGGRRIGSGASTLLALDRIAVHEARRQPGPRHLADLFRARRIAIIHAGGDARRLPAYAALGKIFTPLPCEIAPDRAAALFDLVLQDLRAITLPADGGILLASGDVLLDVAAHGPAVTRPGIAGFAFRGGLDRASRHGVFVIDDDGAVRHFLQKPDAEAARAHDAIDDDGRALIDTGLLAIDAEMAAHWLRQAGVRAERGRVECGAGPLRDAIDGRGDGLDLYAGMLAGSPASAPWIGGRAFHVTVLPECAFLHLGTTRELLDRLVLDEHARARFGFEPDPAPTTTDGAFTYNTVIDAADTRCGRAVLIEGCALGTATVLPGPNAVVGVPAELAAPVELPPGWCLVFLPVDRDDWTALLFGIDDDFKTTRDAGGTFGNVPLADALPGRGLDAAQMWPGADPDEQSLWDARLWVAGRPDEVLAQTLWLARAQLTPPPGWIARPRWSLAQILARVDHRRLVRHRADLQRRSRVRRLAARLRRDPRLSAQRAADDVRDVQDARQALHGLRAMVETGGDACRAARAHRLAARILERHPTTADAWPSPPGSDHTAAAFAAVAQAVGAAAPWPDRPAPGVLRPGMRIDAHAPARIDLAGGWTDTPPICHELGGCVINMAVRIDGEAPVRASVTVIDEPLIRITSADLGQSQTFRDAAPLLDHGDPSDWSALPKAALVLAGCCPPTSETALGAWLATMGGGLEVSIESRLPKGSGLGTSSILGATVLAALARATGRAPDAAAMIELTSRLEQRMGTGGGWQDQAGAITGGIKRLETTPGARQVPDVTPIALPDGVEASLHERLVLYDTGLQRLARNILGNVVRRYLDREPEVLDVLDRLRTGAAQMHRDLEHGDVAAFAAGLSDYWSLKKQIDPGATNDAIEDLIRPLVRDLAGFALPGAGGGGFLFMVARDAGAAAHVRDRLRRDPPTPAGGLREVRIDHDGLAVAASSNR